MVKILDGRKLSEEISKKLEKKVYTLPQKPKLVIVQVGNLPESDKYIERKKLFGTKIGVVVEHKKYSLNVGETKLVSDLQKYSADKSMHGIIVQLPLPKHINPRVVSQAIAPQKEVDGSAFFLPATTKGILTLLEYYKIPIVGKRVVVVGRSELVGKPTALAFLDRGATVTVCHRETKDLKVETLRADILIVAAGKPKLITAKHVSKHQVVIDVGINVVGEKLAGDVDFAKVNKIVRAITPVPGGVGPMTVASLFENLLEAYRLQTK